MNLIWWFSIRAWLTFKPWLHLPLLKNLNSALHEAGKAFPEDGAVTSTSSQQDHVRDYAGKEGTSMLQFGKERATDSR